MPESPCGLFCEIYFMTKNYVYCRNFKTKIVHIGLSGMMVAIWRFLTEQNRASFAVAAKSVPMHYSTKILLADVRCGYGATLKTMGGNL